MTYRQISPWPSNEFFEQRGYGSDGVMHPRPDLHVINDATQVSFVDELQAAGVMILPDDLMYLQNPQRPSPYTESTVSDYRRLLSEARARAQAEMPEVQGPDTMHEDSWQQSA